MGWMTVFDPLFRVPLANGLLLAFALPLLGGYLRMRGEWLAALGYSHLAAAGAVVALPLGAPMLLTASVAAASGATVKGLLPRATNSHYAGMVVLGWSASLILAANTHQGAVVAESVLRGQLYFTGVGHLLAAGLLLAVLLPCLPWLSPRLMLGRFFPDHFAANQLPAWRHRLLFGALVVWAAVLGTVALGAFPAFALFFVPAWVAFILATGWRRAMLLTVGIGVGAYLVAFVLAIGLDQPFGPVLAMVLALTSLGRVAGRGPRIHPAEEG
jgi:zinc/manganese transport system permease protein